MREQWNEIEIVANAGPSLTAGRALRGKKKSVASCLASREIGRRLCNRRSLDRE